MTRRLAAYAPGDVLSELQVERGVALASELHSDHWPPWLVSLAAAIVSDDAWSEVGDHRVTTGMALACVGQPAAGSPRRQKEFDRRVALARPLRSAVLCALAEERRGMSPAPAMWNRS